MHTEENRTPRGVNHDIHQNFTKIPNRNLDIENFWPNATPL